MEVHVVQKQPSVPRLVVLQRWVGGSRAGAGAGAPQETAGGGEERVQQAAGTVRTLGSGAQSY